MFFVKTILADIMSHKIKSNYPLFVALLVVLLFTQMWMHDYIFIFPNHVKIINQVGLDNVDSHVMDEKLRHQESDHKCLSCDFLPKILLVEAEN